eukprot:551269-Prymnesium_polylepis.1
MKLPFVLLFASLMPGAATGIDAPRSRRPQPGAAVAGRDQVWTFALSCATGAGCCSRACMFFARYPVL